MMQGNFNKYLSLAAEVYDLDNPSLPLDAYNFYRHYLQNAQEPILEPMCGTGRFLLTFLEEGFDIHGFDASEYMLAALYAKAKARKLHIGNIWAGFAENLGRDERYGLIFIPSGSFGFVIDDIAVKKTLKTFHQHLKEGGKLVLEVRTSHAVPPLGIWKGKRFRREDGKMFIYSLCTALEGNIFVPFARFELVDQHHVIQTEVEEFKVRIYEPEEMCELLKEVGFKNIRTVKAFDHNQDPEENAKTIIYEAEKTD